ncbi:MAG: reverse transcriptase family protein [Saprospiraceae bacterium]
MASINACNLYGKAKQIFKATRECDILLVQETKMHTEERQRYVKYQWNFIRKNDKTQNLIFLNDNHTRKGGTAILIAPTCPITDIVELEELYICNYYQVIEGKLGDFSVYIHCVYVPQTHKKEFMDKLPRNFPKDSYHLIGGDFNITLSPLDQVNQQRGRSESEVDRIGLHNWIEALQLCDTWRDSNPFSKDFTGPGRKNRIDYILCTNTFHKEYGFKDEIIHEESGSDHAIVKSTWKSRHVKSKKAYWKCPTWIISQEKSVKDVKKFLQKMQDEMPQDPYQIQAFYETIKIGVRGILQKLESQLNTNHRKKKSILVSQKIKAEDYYNTYGGVDAKKCLEEMLQKLNAYNSERKELNNQLSIDSFMECGEKCSKQFLGQFKSFKKTKFHRIKTPDGFKYDSKSIEDGHKEFWGNIYSSNDDPNDEIDAEHQERVLSYITKTLSSSQKENLEKKISRGEIHNAIIISKKGKTCGKDGLPNEVYKIHIEEWIPILFKVFEANAKIGELCTTQREEIKVLLEKGKGSDDPKNLRPIGLINADAKLYSKVIQLRLKLVVPTLIHPDQTGFVKGRQISDNICRFRDMQQSGRDGVAVALDFEKAYDRVNHDFLFKVMEKMNFGPMIMQLIKTLYTKRSFQVEVNGNLTPSQVIRRGVTQGDSPSPILFNLQNEPLGNMLRSKRFSHGVKTSLRTPPVIVQSFADDTLIHTTSFEKSIELVQIVDAYGKASGSKLHLGKSVGMVYGNLRVQNNMELPYKLLKEGESVKYLGIQMGPSLTTEDQVTSVIAQFESVVERWMWRGRTLLGRKIIITIMIESILWYRLAVLPISSRTIQKLEAIVKRFIQRTLNPNDVNGKATKRSPINSNWLYTSVKDGGLGLTPIAIVVQNMRLRRLQRFCKESKNITNYPHWHPIIGIMEEKVPLWINNIWNLFCFPGTMRSHHVKKVIAVLPDVWQEIIRISCKLSTQEPRTRLVTEDWWNTSIWHSNQFVDDKCKSLLAKATYKSANETIKHLMDHGFNSPASFYNHYHRCWKKADDILHEINWTEEHGSTRNVVKKRVQKYLDLIANVRPRSATTGILTNSLFENNLSLLFQNVTTGISMPFEEVSKPEIKKHIFTRPVQKVKLESLEIPAAPNWINEQVANRQLLPQYNDLIWRVYRNSLALGIKMQWSSEVNPLCNFGCTHLESTKHLFWDCHMAQYQWKYFLQGWNILVTQEYTWENIADASAISLKEKYRNTETIQCFSIVRGCIMYTLWNNRNSIVFDKEDKTNSHVAICKRIGYRIKMQVESAIRRTTDTSRRKNFKYIRKILRNESEEYKHVFQRIV